MGSFTFSEIFTIVLIILIVFGPNRLPELSRKIGQFLAWGRRNMQEFTNQVNAEFGDQTQPLADLRKDVEGIKGDISGAVDAITKPLATPLAPEKPDAGQRTTDNGRQVSEDAPGDDPEGTEQKPEPRVQSPDDEPGSEDGDADDE